MDLNHLAKKEKKRNLTVPSALAFITHSWELFYIH